MNEMERGCRERGRGLERKIKGGMRDRLKEREAEGERERGRER